MRVNINYTVTVSDDYRRAINSYYGKPGLATREEVRSWIHMHGSMMDDDIMFELAQKEKANAAEAQD